MLTTVLPGDEKFDIGAPKTLDDAYGEKDAPLFHSDT
jgi:hypothetical protein